MKQVIRDFSQGVTQNADLADISAEVPVVCKNMVALPGKLVKTADFGELQTGPASLHTITRYLNDNLSDTLTDGDSMFVYVWVHPTTNKAYMWGFNSDTSLWEYIGTNIMPQVDVTGNEYYHKSDENPVFQYNKVLRFLPGNVGAPDGTNEAKGIWLGYIDRAMFDGLVAAAPAFYDEPTTIEPPDLESDFATFGIGQYQLKSATEDGFAERDGNAITAVEKIEFGSIIYNHNFYVAGDLTAEYGKNSTIIISDSTGNDGLYKVRYSMYYETSDTTKICVDHNYKEIVDTNVDGYVLQLVPATSNQYYKFSYIYDGTIESLLSEARAVNLKSARNVYAWPYFSLDSGTFNKRITGIKVYRSDTAEGPYSRIHTIDFLRGADDIISGDDGAHFGHNTVYIPELSTYVFDSTKNYKIMLRRDGVAFDGDVVQDVALDDMDGDGYDTFRLTSAKSWRYYDFWDCDWELWKDDGGYAIVESGSSGAYAGQRTIILDQTTGEHDAVGGMVYSVGGSTPTDGTTTAASVDSGTRTRFKSSVNHMLKIGDVVQMSGFTSNENYNNAFVVINVDSDTEFTVDCRFGSNETGGYWALASANWRLVEDNFRKAVLVGMRWTGNQNNNAYKLHKVIKGLYSTSFNSPTVSYSFFDVDLPGLESHPLEGEVSIKVNGRFARMIGDRLWQQDLVLDPGGENEVRGSWIGYSEAGQPDVNPVSNVIIPNDREGGDGAGVHELFGNPVFLYPHAVFMVNYRANPADPSAWNVWESAHNIGNLSPAGAITAAGRLFVCHADGIYALTPNNLAPSDQTPTERLRITDPIGNVYNAMTLAQKRTVRSIYDEHRSEVIFAWTVTVATVDYQQVWAYSTIYNTWREIGTSASVDRLLLDENSYPLIYDDDTNKIYSGAETDSNARGTIRTKIFDLNDTHPVPVRYITVKYQSASVLKLNIYTEHNSTAAATFDLPVQSVPTEYRVAIRTRAKQFQIEITEDHDDYLITGETAETYDYLIAARGGAVNPNFEVHEIAIEHD